MATSHVHRLIVLAAANRVNAVVSWMQANIASECVPADLGPALSASGNEPFTHRWCNASYTDLECRAILFRMCDLASVAKPTLAQWNGWTNAQKRSWYAGVRNQVWTNFQVLVQFMSNTGTWDDPQDVLDALGLQVIEVEL